MAAPQTVSKHCDSESFPTNRPPRAASPAAAIQPAHAAQGAHSFWGEAPIKHRLKTIGRLRQLIAGEAESLARLCSDDPAEALASQVLPLADACRFLEKRAARLLAPRRVGSKGRPAWMGGIRLVERRDPVGKVLIIGASNYPLFLPGVQMVQALAAGNSVMVKPAPGASAPVERLRELLEQSGVPIGQVELLDESPESAAGAIERGEVDKVFLTGSASTGRKVLAAAAEQVIPCVVELSGCDACFVLDGADLALAGRCLAYGLTLNAGHTCIAPRRVFVEASRREALLESMLRALGDAAGEVSVHQLEAGDDLPDGLSEFGQQVALIAVGSESEALSECGRSPYALGASVFGPAAAAREFAGRVDAGVVVVNDVIVPTGDARLAFGGRGLSGFGQTRGAGGLLEMTHPKTVATRWRGPRRHLEADSKNSKILLGLTRMTHGGSLRERLTGLRQLISSAREKRGER